MVLMQSWQLVLLVVASVIILWIAATAIFAAIVNRRHPPTGSFVEIEGARLHDRDRGNPDDAAPVLIHGNGMMVQDFAVGGLVERAASRMPDE